MQNTDLSIRLEIREMMSIKEGVTQIQKAWCTGVWQIYNPLQMLRIWVINMCQKYDSSLKHWRVMSQLQFLMHNSLNRLTKQNWQQDQHAVSICFYFNVHLGWSKIFKKKSFGCPHHMKKYGDLSWPSALALPAPCK